jgi:hypothetical protein
MDQFVPVSCERNLFGNKKEMVVHYHKTLQIPSLLSFVIFFKITLNVLTHNTAANHGLSECMVDLNHFFDNVLIP